MADVQLFFVCVHGVEQFSDRLPETIEKKMKIDSHILFIVLKI